MTTNTKGKVKGEGRIISLNDKFGFLGAQGIKSKVFIIPSSLKADPPFPKLSDILEVDDIVHFEAVEQPERNGAKYVAVDGTVRVKQRGKDVMHEGEGKIVQLDKTRGYFGFVESDIGNVFFNISAVRPSTNDVTKVLKVGQKVKFRCLPNSEQPNCKWRASLVVPMSKVSEFMRHPQNHIIQQQLPLSISKSAVSATSNDDSSGISRPKSTSLSDYDSTPSSPLIFNHGRSIPSQQSNGYRQHIRSVSPVGNNTNSFLEETNRHNSALEMSWASTVGSPPAKLTGNSSTDDEEVGLNAPHLSSKIGSPSENGKCINASAMWDSFLQQQQQLLHPWYAEGRENFYITSITPTNGHDLNIMNNFGSTDNVPVLSSRMSSTLLDSSTDCFYDHSGSMNGYSGRHTPPSSAASSHTRNSNSRSKSVGDPYVFATSIDDYINQDINARSHESICGQMRRLAHDLNGLKDDSCPFCSSLY